MPQLVEELVDCSGDFGVSDEFVSVDVDGNFAQGLEQSDDFSSAQPGGVLQVSVYGQMVKTMARGASMTPLVPVVSDGLTLAAGKILPLRLHALRPRRPRFLHRRRR